MTRSDTRAASASGDTGLFGPRPAMGAAAAAKAVAEDAGALIRAEIALAKAELTDGIRAKGQGAGMFAAAGVLAGLGGVGLLVTVGLALALVMPGWAAALTVSAVMLVTAGVLALVGKRKLGTPVSIETTKHNVEEDVAWTKAALGR